MKTRRNILLFVDQQSRASQAHFYHQRTNPLMEASHFKQLAYTICDQVWAIAAIGEDDRAAFQVYTEAGYDVIRVNNNRPQKLKEMMGEVKRWVMTTPLTQIVFVSAAEDLLELTKTLPLERTQVHVWAPERILADTYKQAPYSFRDLDKLLRPCSRVRVYWDYENLHIALERMGVHPGPKKLFHALQESVGDLGDIVSLRAYADWGELEKRSQMEIQRPLALLDVETSYVINQHDKNSADMRAARDVYLALERDALDVIVIVSGDRDFKDLIKVLRESGKTIVLVGLRSNMNQDVAAVAHHVRYLDDLLNTPVRASYSKENGQTAEDQNLNLIRLVKVIEQRDYAAVEQTALVRSLGIIAIQEFLRKEVLLPLAAEGEKMVELNYKVLEVEQVIHMTQWVVQRIESALERMPWVDTNYLTKGMQKDPKLTDWQIGQTRPSVEYWLRLLEAVGIIVRIKQSHPNNPECIINTWWTPGKALALQNSGKALLERQQELAARSPANASLQR